MGGGSAYFLPRSTPGSKRKDDKDIVDLFRRTGFSVTTTDAEMKAASKSGTSKLLGLYHLENMDGALDRHVLKKGSVDKYPDQPDVADMKLTQSSRCGLHRVADLLKSADEA